MRTLDAVTLSLTGPGSHTIVREPGVGSLSIGPARPGAPPPEVVVGADDTIDWSAFEPLTVPAGYPWPRFFMYQGNDVGIFAWSVTRRIENLEWTPAAPIAVDASAARIGHLSVAVRAPLDIVVPPFPGNCQNFTAAGDLSLLRPALPAGAECPALTFAPDTGPTPAADPVRLPAFPALAHATSVEVNVEPGRQAFDCASLRQYSGVRRLALRGQLTGLAALADLPELTGLQLRYSPDLSDLPPLDTWPRLDVIIGWNIEEATGKRLRGEIRQLTRTAGREWKFASATRLRRPEWFATEYGLPFSGWPKNTARAAVKAYRAAATGIAAATSPDGVEAAIREFVRAVNRLPGIETAEREDAGAAVDQLAAAAPVDVAPDLAQSWFDTERDF